jgi:hypothetical protein
MCFWCTNSTALRNSFRLCFYSVLFFKYLSVCMWLWLVVSRGCTVFQSRRSYNLDILWPSNENLHGFQLSTTRKLRGTSWHMFSYDPAWDCSWFIYLGVQLSNLWNKYTKVNYVQRLLHTLFLLVLCTTQLTLLPTMNNWYNKLVSHYCSNYHFC